MECVEIRIGKAKALAEVADSFWEKTKGLMFRDPLPEAMLFVFDHPRPLSFWMMFVKHAIDMVFIDEKKSIIKIYHSAKPTLNPFGKVYTSGSKAKYVLEFPSGFCRMHGLAKGMQVDFRL